MSNLRAGTFDLVRTLVSARWVGWVIREVFAHMAFVIPLQRLRETPELIAFHHPSPSYPVHILIVPKRSYPSLMAMPPEDSSFLRDLFETVQSLVREFNLEQAGYRLIANGGAYQEIPILHFHLVSER